MATLVGTTSLSSCSVCDSANLEEILDLPALPHIGVYLGKGESQDTFQPIDNALCRCKDCSHIQMKFAVDPAFLYQPSFQHKTSQSVSAMQANRFLHNFIKETLGSRRIEKVAEIGCNDTFFMSLFLTDPHTQLVGIDPILKGREDAFLSGIDPNIRGRFTVIGDFIERADFGSGNEGAGKPDVLVSNFVFEHLARPLGVVKAMLNAVADEGTCFIGVPTAEFMIFNGRFDQLSHQHYQQFSVMSLCNMVKNAGGHIVNIGHNFTNWGQVVVAFRAKKSAEDIEPSGVAQGISRQTFEHSLQCFRQDLSTFKLKIRLLQRKGAARVYGFGAAQNFPIFAYFNDFELPFEAILDDHPLRQNKVFPGVPGIETHAPEGEHTGDIAVLTGPDYARVLFKRIGEIGFDHIVSPFSSY